MAPYFLLSVGLGMSTEQEMWAAFREIDRRLSSFRNLRKLIEREAEKADSVAFWAEGKMRRLGSKKRDLDRDLAETHQ